MLQRWEPFRELRRMDEMMNRLRRGHWGHAPSGFERWAVPLDVVEEDDKIIVRATLPGVKPEDIDVTLENDVLTINAETKVETEDRRENYLVRERRAGKFHRTLRLPDTVDSEKVDTKYENGIVEITFPKAEAKKARRLSIKAA
ncbi:MAG: Hsp20/alpha crystallin family protein [Chloroflexi bacterium]|nr:Hsp20/alpha crystallin family protein [Chloroflexota bacterium]MCH7652138.1 Hsp20/alpha crystallin family protein [Chloroflexota bacterium]